MQKKKIAKNMRKPPPLATSSEPVSDCFEIELYWCIHQLENALTTGKLSQKIAEDTVKNIKVLKSNSAPLVKKRQVMKAALGDYRAKMREEQKTMALSTKQIKFTPQTATNVNTKSSFVKKAAILTTGKDFRFNFNPPTEDSTNSELPVTDAANNISKPLAFTSGGDFKFNFTVDENNEDFNLNGLSIK